jgi:non-heme chloroperoxidase
MSTVTPAWMKGFLGNFYNIDTLHGTLASDQASWSLAVTASAIVAVACIGTWATDFHADVPEIDVPMLVLQATPTRSCRSTRPVSGCPA